MPQILNPKPLSPHLEPLIPKSQTLNPQWGVDVDDGKEHSDYDNDPGDAKKDSKPAAKKGSKTTEKGSKAKATSKVDSGSEKVVEAPKNETAEVEEVPKVEDVRPGLEKTVFVGSLPYTPHP